MSLEINLGKRKCAECGAAVPKGSRNCPECQTALPESTVVTDGAHEESQSAGCVIRAVIVLLPIALFFLGQLR